MEKEELLNKIQKMEEELGKLKNEVETEKYEYWDGDNIIKYIIHPNNKITIIKDGQRAVIIPEELIELKEIFGINIALEEVKYKDIRFFKDLIQSIYQDYFRKID